MYNTYVVTTHSVVAPKPASKDYACKQSSVFLFHIAAWSSRDMYVDELRIDFATLLTVLLQKLLAVEGRCHSESTYLLIVLILV